MKRILLSLFLTAFIQSGYAQLSVAEIFSDHMDLQRGEVVPVWGWSEANDNITVEFNEEVYTAKADELGFWQAEIPPMKTGGPYYMLIKGGAGEVLFNDVMIGDVWLCSGQSNMEWIVANSNNADSEIRNSDHPEIRHFKVSNSWSKDKAEHLEGGPWEVASPETTGDFTAVGYFFARELRKHVDVPIGLLNSSWGGSRIEPWMRIEVVEPYLDTDLDTFFDEKEKERQEVPEKQELDDARFADFDDSSWDSMTLPGLWEQNGYPGMDGIAWVRKEIELTAEEAAEDLELSLAMIDDLDQTYVNGKLVGETNQYSEPRRYDVNASQLKPGTNVILIRITDTGGGGGVAGYGRHAAQPDPHGAVQ
ncbi:MAG: sialate O-acetylesterase [Cyclobacteriaceae bacterium]